MLHGIYFWTSLAAISVAMGSDPTDGGRIYNAPGVGGMGNHPAHATFPAVAE
jgi:hypothetical protein